MRKLFAHLMAVLFVSCGFAFGQGLNDGLVAYYPFNGNANDESGNENDGTVNGATLTLDRFGAPNSAYDFDGTGFIDCPDGTYFSGDFTVSGWVNLREYSYWGRLLDFANNTDDHVSLTLSVEASGRPRRDVFGNANSVLSKEALPLNRSRTLPLIKCQWHHLKLLSE